MLASCLSESTLGEAFEIGLVSVDMLVAVEECIDTRAEEGVDLRPPWRTYNSRYFLYARSSRVKMKGKKGFAEVDVVAYWDLAGLELKLLDGAEW